MEEIAKRRAQNDDFVLRISQPLTAHTMIAMIHTIINNGCEFQVRKNDDFEGIVVESMNDANVCIIHASLRCEVELNNVNNASFALSLKDLSSCLKAMSNHYIMEIRRAHGSDKVTINALEQMSETKINSCNLSTLSGDFERPHFKKLEYKYTVRIDLHIFRSIVRMARDLNAEDLSFRVYSMVDGDTVVFCLSAEGTTSHIEHYFPSTQGEGEIFSVTNAPCDIDTLSDTSKWTLDYEDAFALTYLSKFISTMERSAVTMRLSPGKPGEPNLPLLVIFQLGGDDSNVMYVLAPKVS